MVIYAFEKLRIIFSVIIFHFKEPVSNINIQNPSPHCLTLAFMISPPFILIFSEFSGILFLFPNVHPPILTHTNPTRIHTPPSLPCYTNLGTYHY